MTDIDLPSDLVDPSPTARDQRYRTAKWLFFVFLTGGWIGLIYLKCLVLGDRWFPGTAMENAISALLLTPWMTFWIQLVLHIHLLRREGVYRRREIWLISQSFQLFQGLFIGVTAIPQTPEHLRAFLFVLLAAPLVVVLLAPFFSRHKLAFQVALLLQIILLVAYAMTAIHFFLNGTGFGGAAIHLTILASLSLPALAMNSFGLKSRLDRMSQNAG